MCIKFMIISDLCMLISTIYICIIQKQNNVSLFVCLCLTSHRQRGHSETANVSLFCVFYEKVCISISCYM